MLWRAEVKKILLVRKGLLVLAVCLLAKILFLCAFPEMKDSRISLSQNQYDKYLRELYEESTPEKNEWIKQEYAWCLETIGRREDIEKQYAEREITEDEYQAYAKELDTAYLHRNASQIFTEKAAQFEEQEPGLPPAWYIYEYGWQTVFFLQQFPDVFLLAGLLLFAAQSFASESAVGMLPVLLSAKNGKTRLFLVKLMALLFVGLAAALVFGGAEILVFCLRGWCNDAQAPVYSVSLMTNCRLSLSLGAGYDIALLVRTGASLLLLSVLFGASIWLRSPVNTVFTGMCLLIVPLLLDGGMALYTHGGLLCGSRLLNAFGAGGTATPLPLFVVAVYSGGIILMSYEKYKRGI